MARLFCNVGRGSAVVDTTLVAALESGTVAAAALDVFNREPLHANSPYWSMPNVRVSAHCSSVPAVSIRRVHEMFRANLRRYLDDQALHNELDLVSPGDDGR